MSSKINHLEMRDIVKRFPGVLSNDHVSIDVSAGEVLALLGENGAGKTTLMKMIAGLVRPDAGRIEVFGRVVSGRSITTRSLVGLVPQDNNMERELTVEEALTIYGRLFAVPCLTRYCTHWSICFLLGWEWAGDRGWAMSISVAFFIWGVALIRNYSE